LTKFLVLFPIATALAIAVFLVIFGLFMSKKNILRGQWNCFPMTFRYARGLLAINSLALLITSLALVVEIAVAGIMDKQVKRVRNPSLKLVWGNMIYLTALALLPIIYNYLLLYWLKQEIRDEVLCNILQPKIEVTAYVAPDPESQRPPSQFAPQYPATYSPSPVPNPQYPTYGTQTPPPNTPNTQYTAPYSPSPVGNPQYPAYGTQTPPPNAQYPAPDTQYAAPNPQYPSTTLQYQPNAGPNAQYPAPNAQYTPQY